MSQSFPLYLDPAAKLEHPVASLAYDPLLPTGQRLTGQRLAGQRLTGRFGGSRGTPIEAGAMSYRIDRCQSRDTPPFDPNLAASRADSDTGAQRGTERQTA